MLDVCIIGHITSDINQTPKNEIKEMPGGTAYYSSLTLKNLGSKVCVVTKTAKRDKGLLGILKEVNIPVFHQESQKTTIFENIYPKDFNTRIQNVKTVAEPFNVGDISEMLKKDFSSRIFHLGPLTKEDMPLEILKRLSRKAKISLDAQGFVRKIDNSKVKNVDWEEKKEGLTYINILHIDETEAKILSGEKDIKKAATKLSIYGIDEIIITCGTSGSLIYSKREFYPIPSFSPRKIVDTTGCGDTYVAAYIHKRLKSSDINEAGRFAAATSALKAESFGAFKGREETVHKFLEYQYKVIKD
ncbi:MAG: PfkB family carbohydrate kinase [Promethearchaeota archaeon]